MIKINTHFIDINHTKLLQWNAFPNGNIEHRSILFKIISFILRAFHTKHFSLGDFYKYRNTYRQVSDDIIWLII